MLGHVSNARGHACCGLGSQHQRVLQQTPTKDLLRAKQAPRWSRSIGGEYMLASVCLLCRKAWGPRTMMALKCERIHQ